MSKQSLALMTPEIREAFPQEVLDVIRTSICPTASDSEFLLFVHKAASYGLDPFKNEIFFIKYGNQVRIQFAAEAYLSKAREKEGFQPPDTQMVCENDEFRAVRNPETKELEVAVHETGFPRGKIIGAYSISYRDGYRPVTVIMDRSEVEHMFTGQNKENWTKWTSDMFGKHVEQRALKKQYGLEFGDDDMPQQSVVDATDNYQRRDITAEVHQTNNAAPPSAPTANDTENQPEPIDKYAQQQDRLSDNFEKLGITRGKKQYAEARLKPKDTEYTLQEMIALNKILELEIAEKEALASAGGDGLGDLE